MKNTYQIKGMHCLACVQKIQLVLSSKVKIIDITLDPPRLIIESETLPSLNELNELISTAGNYSLQPAASMPTNHPHEHLSKEEAKGFWAYYPLILIALYILGVAGLNNIHSQNVNWHGLMNQCMAGFFLVFSAFKLLDLRGFADGYRTYDLLAKRFYAYGFIYPFIELILGILYLTNQLPITTQYLTIAVMSFSSLGVINSLLKKQQIHCACLGTLLKVPLSTITLVEDLTMVLLAIFSLVVKFS